MNRIVNRLLERIGRYSAVSGLLRQPQVYSTVRHLPGARALFGSGWDVIHPFDREHGTETSGFVSADMLPASATHEERHFYAGSQPSIVRSVLASLPQVTSSTFIDLGCGKGRPLLVASEFPFRDIVGVEVSAELGQICERNAQIYRAKFPERTPIRIEVKDASEFTIPDGDYVIFMYNPFGASTIEKILKRVAASLAESPRIVYVIYYNPTAGNVVDRSSVLSRRLVRMFPYAAGELSYGPDESDLVGIWQSELAPPLSQSESGESVHFVGEFEGGLQSAHPTFRAHDRASV